MPKKSCINVGEYYEKKEDIFVCNLCKKEFKSCRNYNLKKHLEKMHSIIFAKESDNVQTASFKYKTKNIKCEISKKLLIKSYIGLVTDESVSFNVLNSMHMKNIINPICKGIEKQSGIKFCLNAANCKKTLAKVATNIIKSISLECQNKLISLKVDSASRLSRNIFGVSAQFMKNDTVESRILAMVEIKGQNCSTSKNLATEILNVLTKYDISLQQIVSITSDNGSNMIKSTKMLSHSCKDDEDEVENNDNEVYFETINLLEVNTDLRVGDIVICRCAAHTAQLCALDVIKNLNIKNFITNCRNVVKFLRKNSNGYKDLFELKSVKVPQLDCPTRWGSTFSMLSDLMNSKELLDSIESVKNKTSEENFNIDEDFWNYIESYCLVLSPLQKSIIKFQEEQLNYGDFYAQWLTCKLLTKKIKDENSTNETSILYKISSVLLESIENRENRLFENNGLTASLYLDHRFHHLLTGNQKADAIVYLNKLWKKIISISQIETNTHTNLQSSTQPTQINDVDYDILNTFLNQEFHSNNIEVMDVSKKIEKINLPCMKSNTNVLEFWKDKKHSDPELYSLSNICYAIPPTQVSVERAFSSLKLVLAENRNRLSNDTLENILLVKLNPKFLDEAIDNLELFAENNDNE